MVFGVGSWDSKLKVRLWSPLIGIQQSGNQKKKVHCMLQLENLDHSRIWSLTFVWKGMWGLPSYNGISYVMSPEFLKLQRCRPCDTKDDKDQQFSALQDSKQLVLWYIYWTQRMLKILGIMRNHQRTVSELILSLVFCGERKSTSRQSDATAPGVAELSSP